MTKRTTKRWVLGVVAYFAFMVVVGSLFRAIGEGNPYYSTLKDLLPLIIAIPVAWLSFCFQRRITYVQQLRTMWSRIVDAVHTALQYAGSSATDDKAHSDALIKMSVAIDEVRALFMNLNEKEGDDGLYPFEPLKDIHGLLESMGCGEGFRQGEAARTRKKMFALWKDVRRELLKEFDREVPTFPHSHWKNIEKSDVYTQHGIRKRPT